MIDVCAKAGDVVKAEEWLKCMTDAGVKPDAIIYNMIKL